MEAQSDDLGQLLCRLPCPVTRREGSAKITMALSCYSSSSSSTAGCLSAASS